MKNILITLSILFIVCVFSAFQTNQTKPQFFVEGYTEFGDGFNTKFNVSISGENLYFTNKFDMLKEMNKRGYKAVSVAYNTYRMQGYEVYIFE